jgi:hypothetical protein
MDEYGEIGQFRKRKHWTNFLKLDNIGNETMNESKEVWQSNEV